MTPSSISYKRHRFPPQIIAHMVWLYCRFSLSPREVEDMLLERGIDVPYETVGRWCNKFGSAYSRQLRRKKACANDVWLLDEMMILIQGKHYYLWRAVDQNGYVLDEILQKRRNTKAAKRLLTRFLTKQGMAPKLIVTDKLFFTGPRNARSCPMLNIGPTRASTIVPRTTMSHCENGSGPCRYSSHRDSFKGFWQSSLAYAICLSPSQPTLRIRHSPTSSQRLRPMENRYHD